MSKWHDGELGLRNPVKENRCDQLKMQKRTLTDLIQRWPVVKISLKHPQSSGESINRTLSLCNVSTQPVAAWINGSTWHQC